MDGKRKRVVIIGAGYAGLRCAWDLKNSSEIEVILIDKDRNHVELPAMYEVATACLPHESTQSSEKIAETVQYPIEDIFRNKRVSFLHKKVEHIQLAEKSVVLDDGSFLSWDMLVIAVGTTLGTFGIPGVREHAYSVKTIGDAVRMRHHVVSHYRRLKLVHAENAADIKESKTMQTFVVVGAGASGVETATELVGNVECACLDHCDHIRIVLLEAGPEILKGISPKLREKAMQRLRELDIEVRLNARVTEVTHDSVILDDGKDRIHTHTVLWSGGLALHPLFSQTGLETSRWGVAVKPTLQAISHPEVFVPGDAGIIGDSKIPANVPVAYEQGALVARNIRRAIAGEDMERFVYIDKGQLITLGGKKALVVFPNGSGWVGFLPWLAKRLVSWRYWWRFLGPLESARFCWRALRLHAHND